MCDQPKTPSTGGRKRFGIGNRLFVAIFVVAGLVVVPLAVEFGGESSPWDEAVPLQFSDAVRKEKDPFVADVRALGELLRQRWPFLDHRRRISAVNLGALERRAIAALRGVEEQTARETLFRRVLDEYADLSKCFTRVDSTHAACGSTDATSSPRSVR